ncbi:hypothetical protein HAHE_33600 [Haloferula helveola]|uniref:Uncharacterized protein n=1 Tax=Haloferula helveola TaxID=490095 RepID=A0ABM7RIW7_9BACT|nr:hypothetical protein HAHE_33600 [Haloferula helveola]
MKTLIALLLLTAFVSAQEGKVSLRFITFPRVKDAGPIELLTGKSVVQLTPPSNRLSDPVEVAAQDRWRFGKSTEEDGKPAFDDWGTCNAGNARNQIVMLLRKGPANEDGFHVVCLDDGPKHFKQRQMFFMNLSRQPIAGEVGSVKFALKPGDQTIISPKPDKGEELCHATLLLERKKGWHPFLSSNWPLTKQTRGLIFIYNDPRTAKLRLHTIRDFL